jgi:hypothetical protein
LLDDFCGGEDGAGDKLGEGGSAGVHKSDGKYAVWRRGRGVEAREEGFCALVGCEESSCYIEQNQYSILSDLLGDDRMDEGYCWLTCR